MSAAEPQPIKADGGGRTMRLKAGQHSNDDLEVVEVTTRGQLKQFLSVPERLHGNDPVWVPPLYMEQRRVLSRRSGPFFKDGRGKLWLALRGAKPVGRLTSHVSDRYDQYMGGRKGFFGFFACEDSPATAKRLFSAAREHLRAEGRDEIEGPFSFTVYDELGILVEGFDTQPAFLVAHNPPYYGQLLVDCGFAKAIDWYAYRGTRGETDTQLPERLSSLADRVLQQNKMELRPLDFSRFKQESLVVKGIFEKAWDRNWGHVPMSDAEFWSMAAGLKQIVVPNLSCIVSVDGQPVGVALSVYDINPIIKSIRGKLFPFGFIRMLRDVKKMKRFRMLLMGVLPRHRGRGYEVAMYVHSIRTAIKMGFDEAEMSLIVQDNEPMIKSIENLTAQRSKTLRIFRASIT